MAGTMEAKKWHKAQRKTGIRPIIGTSIFVDYFGVSRPDVPSAAQQRICNAPCFFLSHFHTDHRQGLTSEFSGGQIYCSKVTKKLLGCMLGLVNNVISIELNTPTRLHDAIGGIFEVTFFYVDHCPGAVMFYFVTSDSSVFYCGDGRLPKNRCEDIQRAIFPLTSVVSQDASLAQRKSAARKLFLDVYLDITFAQPDWGPFPSKFCSLMAFGWFLDSHPDSKFFFSFVGRFGQA
eukprot:GHVT01066018.1.p1 GENE.GHVT01066018.1~~GHVT01066018.1.p1  ORF type:complete len:234 (+),score=10.84 GHVT01066018.1:459-1160(+)